MQPPFSDRPFETDLVLIGGGHAHLAVLRAFAMKPEPGLRLTVIAKELEAPYSGMLPGFVAGVYDRAACHIDLAPLAEAAQARLIHGAATGLDLAERRVRIAGRPDLGFDLLSLDVGITPRQSGIEGAAAHGIAVKPVSEFAARWEALRAAAAAPGGPRRLAVIGGGAAGFELALAARRGLAEAAPAAERAAIAVTLIAGGPLLRGFPDGARRRALKALRRAGVALIEEDPALALDVAGAALRSGARIAADAALIAAESQAPPWLAETGLDTDDAGYLAVGPSLESLSHGGVFAAGDCAAVQGFPRPKAGVFAVRQGPPLAANLRGAARGSAPRPHRPQTRFLSLLSTADGRAIAARAPFVAEGRWVWRWKDRIDRAFMEKHRPDPLPLELDETMRCGGCAAKVGPLTLRGALDRLGAEAAAAAAGAAPEASMRDPGAGRDDAAVIDPGGGSALRLETVDFFTAFWRDPWLLGRIAANHALGDIYAMGGRPETAQAILALPPLRPRLAEEDLHQLTAGAQSLLAREGAALIGGHSSEGPALAAGFAVSGAAPRERLLRKGGAQPGDRLILTRPIGSGLLLAAAMRRRASSEAVFAALERMQASHAAPMASLLAHGARAATDVTGFGLGGHLLEMLEAADLSAALDLGAVPLLPEARALAEAGLASSLTPANLALAGAVTRPDGAAPSPGTLSLLFDPQTAGPLVAALPAAVAGDALAALHEAGAPEAAVIGTVTERPGPCAARLIVD